MQIAFGKNFKDTVPRMRDMSFEQFVDLIKRMPRHHGKLSFSGYALAGKLVRGRDKDSKWFIPAIFIRPERKANAVGSLVGFVMDFDDGKITGEDIEERLGAGGPYKFVAWTSYSHGLDGKAKWRVFIPYQHPITPKEHVAVYEHFQQVFENHLDPRCKTVSQ